MTRAAIIALVALGSIPGQYPVGSPDDKRPAVVIGRVVWIHAADGLVDDRFHVDPARLAAIGRMAGLTYCTTRQRFEIPWGKDALAARDVVPRRE